MDNSQVCNQKGCSRKAVSRGFCGTHYQEDRVARLGYPDRKTHYRDWLRKKGFASSAEYLDHLAQKKGFANNYERRKQWILDKGYKSVLDYLNTLARHKGYDDYADYRRCLAGSH